ncbi:MAG: hypothetical protein F4W95_00580 [Chloroflexi bacterium]|nr:hypothetical protein [Chloroflexota bacterium]MYD46963.1 hypothetical protein [Chloroflexota bacterium]
MILAALVSLAFVIQVVMARPWIEGDDPNIFEAYVWFAISVLNFIALGRSLSKWVLWRCMTRIYPRAYASYLRWGMEREVENQAQTWLHGTMFPVLVLLSFVTVSIFTTTLAPILTEAMGFLDTLGELSVFWAVAFLVSIIWVLQEHTIFDRKRQALDDLRPTYRQRFTPSELLSMYECLRAAPPLFWREYQNLPDVQVTEATNQKFRERAAPYSSRGSNVLQRRAFIAAVVAVLAAVGTFVEASIGGGIVQWFISELSK